MIDHLSRNMRRKCPHPQKRYNTMSPTRFKGAFPTADNSADISLSRSVRFFGLSNDYSRIMLNIVRGVAISFLKPYGPIPDILFPRRHPWLYESSPCWRNPFNNIISRFQLVLTSIAYGMQMTLLSLHNTCQRIFVPSPRLLKLSVHGHATP